MNIPLYQPDINAILEADKQLGRETTIKAITGITESYDKEIKKEVKKYNKKKQRKEDTMLNSARIGGLRSSRMMYSVLLNILEGKEDEENETK